MNITIEMPSPTLTPVIDFAASPRSRSPRRAPGATTNPEPIAIVPTTEPHPVFGRLPPGFVLKDQTVETLVHWLHQAMKVVDDLPEGFTDDALTDAMTTVNEIFEAIKSLEVTRPSAVNRQIGAVAKYLDFLKSNSIEEAIEADDFRLMAANLEKATAPIRPKKKVGALQRGRKLTRAGLLTRYQSFLIQELETVSVELYGERDLAKRYVAFDDAVNDRCRGTGNIFDQKTLPARARAVLKSLKINTELSEQAIHGGTR